MNKQRPIEKRRARAGLLLGALAAACVLTSCARQAPSQTQWFPELDVARLQHSTNVNFISGLKGYQQTTDYTCGPSALLSLSKYYGAPGVEENQETEMRIAAEAGARDCRGLKPGEKPGLPPEAAVQWLKANGFDAELSFEEKGDYSSLARLRENIRRGIPTMTLWVAYGAHWVLAVGYDDRGTPQMGDDVVIFSDSADVCDDYRDGYSFANAERFYWSWFDVLYYEGLKWRPMITPVYTNQPARP